MFPDDQAKQFGNYVTVKTLGQGGMGTVYLARHPHIGREVAIKVLAEHLGQSPSFAQRFLTEAKSVVKIKHPNVIEIYDFGQTEHGLYCVMEFLEGCDLKETMKKHGPMEPATAFPYFLQICAGLQAAHNQGIVHRDLKPSNIFVLESEPLTVKILDFGIAKILEPDPTTPSVTYTGMIVGTPTTMAPEQASAKPYLVGTRTDLYSLGIVMYWMLVGKPPFVNRDSQLLALEHINTSPKPLHEVDPKFPIQLSDLIDRCLEKEPTSRPNSAFEIAKTLSHILDEGSAMTIVPKPTNNEIEVYASNSVSDLATVPGKKVPPTTAKTLSKPEITTMGATSSEISDKPTIALHHPTSWSFWSLALISVIALSVAIYALTRSTQPNTPHAAGNISATSDHPQKTQEQKDLATESQNIDAQIPFDAHLPVKTDMKPKRIKLPPKTVQPKGKGTKGTKSLRDIKVQKTSDTKTKTKPKLDEDTPFF